MPGEGNALPPVTPDMTCHAAGRAVLALHFGRLVAHEAGTVEGSDPEALHDMRVATRRLRAACRVFRDALGRETLAPHLAEVRWLADLFGQVRDLDVFLAWLHTVEASAPEALRPAFAAVTASYSTARSTQRTALVAALGSPRYVCFKEALAALLRADAQDMPRAGDQPVTRLARRAVQAEWARVLRKARQTRADDLAGLHEVRIACKRLRYTAESFADLYPDRLQDLTDVCVAVQDALGEMHDAYIHAEALRKRQRQANVGPAERMALQQMMRALQRKQAAAHQQFLQHYPTLTSQKFTRRAQKRLAKPIKRP